jgi:hypothetical protein
VGPRRRTLGDPGPRILREARDRFASLGAAPLVAEVEAFLT